MFQKKNLIPMAICYDFDGTLSPGNMQEYGFIKKLGIAPEDFWKESNQFAKNHQMDGILAYMKMVIDKSKENHLPFRRQDFQSYGKTVQLYPGVEKWFRQISAYALKKGIQLDHYIISSGMKEMIEGTKIARCFKEIFASSFLYDENGVAVWPAVALNYTTKTQFLFRINKGCLDLADDKSINRFIPLAKRALPFEQMIYIGDGETDIPCMRMVKDMGGYSVAVYKDDVAKKTADRLVYDKRVNLAAVADYSKGQQIDLFVRAVVDKIQSDHALEKEIQKGK